MLARSATKSESIAPTDVAWQVCSGPSSWREEEWLTVQPPDKESAFAAFGSILKLSASAAKEKASADKERMDKLRRSTIANPMGLEMAKLKEKFRGEDKEIYPRGWSEGVDDDTGEVIWKNEFTGDTVREEPKLPAPPVGYSVGTDESGQVVFNNLETGESQSEHPLGEIQVVQAPPGRLKSFFIKRGPTKEEEELAAANALPRGWTAAESDDGHTFYTNKFTGNVEHEKPSLPAPPEGWHVAVNMEDESKFSWTNIETGELSAKHPLGEEVLPKKKKLHLKKLVAHLMNDDYMMKSKNVVLPRGWKSEVTDDGGATYFHNEHTGHTVWEKPSLPAPPEGWHVDRNDAGVVFYTSIATGEGQWSHPHGELIVTDEEAKKKKKKKKKVLRPKKLAAKMFKKRKKNLPVGWTESVAEDGSPLYTNATTGLVQSERPHSGKKTKTKKKKKKKKKEGPTHHHHHHHHRKKKLSGESTGITSQDRLSSSLLAFPHGEGKLATLREGGEEEEDEEEDWSGSSSGSSSSGSSSSGSSSGSASSSSSDDDESSSSNDETSGGDTGSDASGGGEEEAVHPRGWSEHDDGDGVIYYNNDHTGKTTFTKPTLPAAPEGWSVYAHGDDGGHYFENDAGGKQWHHPHDDDPSTLQPEKASSFSSSSSSS